MRDSVLPPPIIALLTDFGDRDEYVGVMKGVVLRRAPGARIVDLCHHIAPHDICQAAAMIDASFAYFPDHTLFVMVVDPGVGGDRGIVLATAGARAFVCPDNGLLTGLIRRGIVDSARRITNQALFGDPVSPTFHGRDIMAPVAGYLAAGGLPEELGPLRAVSELVCSEAAPARREADGSVLGRVVSVDRFGNVITDIGCDLLTSVCGDDLNSILTIEVGTCRRIPLVPSYSARPRGELLATIGSRGTLEIAVNTGHAADRLDIVPGLPVRVRH